MKYKPGTAEYWREAYREVRRERDGVKRINEVTEHVASTGRVTKVRPEFQLDEIVVTGLVHVERMDDDHVILIAGDHHFSFYVEGKRLAFVSQDIERLRLAAEVPVTSEKAADR